MPCCTIGTCLCMCMSLEYSASLYHPSTQLSISTASNVSEEGLETRPCSCLCTRNFFDDMIYSGTVARACLLLCSHFVGLKTNKHPRCIFKLSLHPWLPMTMHLLLCNLYLCSLAMTNVHSHVQLHPWLLSR